jgi:hypothetical protein
MEKTAENKNYATDTRKFSDGVLADKIHKVFTDSPVTDLMIMKDLCYRGPGFIGQHGKETKTSWDTLSYTLIQAHNVYQHMTAVQEANRRYENGIKPKMVMDPLGNLNFSDIVDEIFSLKDREKSLAMIDKYDKFWQQFKAGQGFSGKKTVNAHTMFNKLFSVEEVVAVDEVEVEEVIEDTDELMTEVLNQNS